MDGPGTYSQPPYAGGSKDESGTAAKDTISIGSGDRVSGEDRMGMEVHAASVHIWFMMKRRKSMSAMSEWMKMTIIGLSGVITGNARITETVMSIRL